MAIPLLAAVVSLIVALHPLRGQTGGTGSIEGRVLNSVTGAYLANVRISVEGSHRETVTDANGEYRLPSVPAGAVRLRASYFGLEDKSGTVTVVAGRSTRGDFELDRNAAEKDLVKMDKVTVVADREIDAQTMALNEQRTAPNIKTVVAFDEYPTGYDSSLGYFLRFVPGVSGTSVRALPGDMGAITIDGAPLTGVLTGQTRAASIGVVPVNNISRIEVTKVPTPDMPANIGGAINIISKSGLERSTPLFTYNVYSAWTTEVGTSFNKVPGLIPQLNQRSMLPSGSFTYVRPINKTLAVTINAGKQQNYSTQVGTISTWDLTNLVLTNINSTWTPNILTTVDGRIAVDWKFTPKDVITAALQYRSRQSWQYEQGLRIDFGSFAAGSVGGQTSVRGARNAGGVTQTQSTLVLNSDTKQVLLKYKHTGDVWRIDASASDSKSRSFYGNLNNGFIYLMNTALTGLTINADGLNSAGNSIENTRPQSYAVVDNTGRQIDPRDGNNLVLTSASSTYPAFLSVLDEVKVNFEREWDTAVPFGLKFGGIVQPFKSTGQNAGGNTWTFRPGTPAAERTAGNYGIVDAAYSAQGPIWAGGRVQWISPAKAYGLFTSRPEYFVLDQATSYTTRVTNSRKLEETISAGYVRLDAKLLKNRLWLVGGVRMEQTADQGWGPQNDPTAQYQKDARGNVVKIAGVPQLITTDALQRALLRYKERAVHVKRTYSGYYPSFNANYSIRDDLMVRFGYGKTIGRPPITSIVPSVTLPDATTTSGTITVNNTGLKPWSATNFDLSVESYLLKDGTGSVSFFQKDIKDFPQATTTAATPELLDLYGVVGGDAGSVYNVSTTINGGDAQLRGVEVSYKQRLTFLPDWARGFQVFGNWTRRTVTGPNFGNFSGFFPSSISWGVNLTRPRFAVKFSSTYRGEIRGNRIAASATIPADTFDWSRASLSYQASAQYRITPHVELYGTLVDFNKTDNLIGLRRHNPNTPRWASDRQTLRTFTKAVAGVRGEF